MAPPGGRMSHPRGTMVPMEGITCERCGHQMPVEQAVLRQVEARVRAELAEQAEKAQKELIERVRMEAVEAAAVRLNDVEAQLAEQKKALADARKNELALLKKERELQERVENLELEAQRKMQAERDTLVKKAKEQAAEEHLLKDKEKEKQLSDLRAQIAALKRKSEVHNNEHAGTAQEMTLEERLREAFPDDRIERVGKGKKGSDIVQTVMHRGEGIAHIVIESKNTKSFSQGWIAKLKADMIEAQASVALLVSQALPAGIASFGHVDGVWVSDLKSAVGLVAALRMGLIQVFETRRMSVDRGSKADALFEFVAGDEFRNRIQAIVEAFQEMQHQLQRERIVFEKQWKEREQQLTSVLTNTAALVGSMRGIAGRNVPEIEGLALPA